MMKHFCILFIFLNSLLNHIYGQTDSLWGKYKLTEFNGINYEGFALLPDSKAILLKVYTKKFLYDHDLPKDSLTLVFNPGIKKITEFPAELSLVQPILVRWKMENKKLILMDGELQTVFRWYKTSFVADESQIMDFRITDKAPMYYQIERWDSSGQPISKMKVFTFNGDHIPSNFDYYEFFASMPKQVILRTSDDSYRDTIWFEKGKGRKEIVLASKSLKPKNNFFSNFELNKKRLAGYFYNTRHGYEYTYYHPDEIMDTYVGKKFLLKCEAWYERGEKHGKWLYYDTKGNLVKTEIWKKGQLSKTIPN
ncbi:MAG: hypothetical protein R2799_14735 [Crocinitomicaceae bacterium]